MTEDHITNSIIEDLDEEKPSKIKKALIILSIISVLIIFVLYASLGPVLHHIEGKIHSNNIISSSLIIKPFIIHFEENTSSILSQLFINNQEINNVEMSVCLEGHNIGDEYYINKVFYPKIIEQTMTHVTFSTCPYNSVIMLHSHPFGDCLASETDLTTLKKIHKTNPSMLMLIMCGNNTYALYY